MKNNKKSKWRNIYENYLQNIAIASCYSSPEITCFNQMTLIAVSNKLSKKRINKRRFQKALVPLKWVEERQGKIFPTFMEEVGYALGGHKQIEDIVGRLIGPAKESMEDIIDDYSEKEKTDHNGEPGRTKSYRWGFVKQYVNNLEKISKKYEVPFCNVALIYQIISASRNQPKLYNPDRIIEHFNDKEFDSTLENEKKEILESTSYYAREEYERLIEVLIGEKLQDVFGLTEFFQHVNFVLGYNEYYNAKSLSLEENREIFLKIYDEIYNFHREVIWLFVWIGMIDYWIIDSFIKEGADFEKSKQLLASWSPFRSKSEGIKNIDAENHLNTFIGKKYFWVDFFPDLNVVPFFSLYSTKGNNALKQYSRFDHEGKLNFRPDYKVKGSSLFNPDINYSLETDYFMHNGYPIQNEKLDKYEEEADRYLSSEKFVKYDKPTTYVNPQNNEETTNTVKSTDELEITHDKRLIYKNNFRKRAEKYLFKQYQLSGDKNKLNSAIISNLDYGASDYLSNWKGAALSKELEISGKTGARYVQEYKKENPFDNSVEHIEDIPIGEIERIRRQKENEELHRIPGYITQNQLCKLLAKREPFNQKSPKTIMRRLQKLIEDGKIDTPMIKKTGKYFKEENVKSIVNELMTEMFGCSLAERVKD